MYVSSIYPLPTIGRKEAVACMITWKCAFLSLFFSIMFFSSLHPNPRPKIVYIYIPCLSFPSICRFTVQRRAHLMGVWFSASFNLMCSRWRFNGGKAIPIFVITERLANSWYIYIQIIRFFFSTKICRKDNDFLAYLKRYIFKVVKMKKWFVRHRGTISSSKDKPLYLNSIIVKIYYFRCSD